MATITRLPIDFKGTLSSNRRAGEEHTLTKVNGKVNRMFTPLFGAFYTNTLEVRLPDGKLLVRDKDYVTTYYYRELGDVTSKEICAIIVIINPAIGTKVRITYQAFGGHYALSIKELQAVLDETERPATKIKWEDIIDKPLAYVPADHSHEYWQLYGFESTVINLEALANAWVNGRKAVLDDGRTYYQNYINLAGGMVDSYRAQVNAHLADKANPHLTTATKIGLGKIKNWPMATANQSLSTTLDNVYQPIGGVYRQLTEHLTADLRLHIDNKNNPHNVLLSDPLLNLYSTVEINNKFSDRLGGQSVAANSNKFAGLTADQVWTSIRGSWDVSNVDQSQKFHQTQFAPYPTGQDHEVLWLTGVNSYRWLGDPFQTANAKVKMVYFVGSVGGQAFANARAAVDQFVAAWNPPVGSWLIGQYGVDYNDRRVSPNLLVCELTSSGIRERIGQVK